MVWSTYHLSAFFLQVVVELVVGFLLIVIAQTVSLKLKPMRVSANIKSRTYEESMMSSDFMVFNHRGKFVNDRLRSSAH